jgi:hypothetical protein
MAETGILKGRFPLNAAAVSQQPQSQLQDLAFIESRSKMFNFGQLKAA